MNVLSLIVVSIAIMLLLAFSIVIFVVNYQRKVIRHQVEIKSINDQKQLELIQASIQGQEEERMRIATELHDDVGATLSSVRLFLHSSMQKDADESVILQSKQLLDQSIRSVRNISHKLQPAILNQLGLHASLESFASIINRSSTLSLTYRSLCPLPKLSEATELSVYRMLQELTSNLIKHSGARSVDIESSVQHGFLQIIMSHDGQGLTNEMYQELIYKKGAIGLKNIVNRLKSINATIEFSSAEKGNFRICILTPIVS